VIWQLKEPLDNLHINSITSYYIWATQINCLINNLWKRCIEI
jgi:hypothetical protein